MSGEKLTKAQIATLQKIAKRDWPAGEPRRDWFGKATLRVLTERGLITERANSAGRPFTWSRGILDLTPAGLSALSMGTDQ